MFFQNDFMIDYKINVALNFVFVKKIFKLCFLNINVYVVLKVRFCELLINSINVLYKCSSINNATKCMNEIKKQLSEFLFSLNQMITTIYQLRDYITFEHQIVKSNHFFLCLEEICSFHFNEYSFFNRKKCFRH